MGSAEDGEALVKIALEKFGGVHVLIANAGILRDKSFVAMSEQEWDAVIAVRTDRPNVLSLNLASMTGIGSPPVRLKVIIDCEPG